MRVKRWQAPPERLLNPMTHTQEGNAMRHWWDEVTLSLRSGVSLEQLPPLPEIATGTASAEHTLHGWSPLLEGLQGQGQPVMSLVQRLPPEQHAQGLAYLAQLDGLGLLAFGIGDGSRSWVSLQPMVQGSLGVLRPIDSTQTYRLSRFAFVRRLGAWSVLESPRVPALLRLDEPLVGTLLLHLNGPSLQTRWASTIAAEGMMSERVTAERVTTGERLATLEALFGLLVTSGFLVACDPHGLSEEEQQATLATWSFHELLFHRRSRPGNHAFPVGKTWPFKGIFEPLPALRPRHPQVIRELPLEKPPVSGQNSPEPSLFELLERRRSERVHGTQPLSFSALSALLYHALRVQETLPLTPGSGYEVTRRPYPSGGASYDLEVYLITGACEQLEPGLYHYDPAAHALHMLTGETPALQTLRLEAMSNCGVSSSPQLLLCLASRFQRMSWSYQNMPYAITLKNAGVVYQTLYLVATALGLACCGMGRGNSTLFAQAAGLDELEETTVGELIIGSHDNQS
ncbi:MAG: SagB family peptide dehydrogenase [Myxococcota bacterium]